MLKSVAVFLPRNSGDRFREAEQPITARPIFLAVRNVFTNSGPISQSGAVWLSHSRIQLH
jgi:hypothetical protein